MKQFCISSSSTSFIYAARIMMFVYQWEADNSNTVMMFTDELWDQHFWLESFCG